MNEAKEQNGTQTRPLRSRFMTITVEADEHGKPCIVMRGDSLENAGFVPGENIEAIVQPGLISILRTD